MNLIKREAKLIISDLDLIVIILLSPVLYSIFYSTVYINKSEENVPVIIVDADNSMLSKSLIRNLDSHRFVEAKEITGDFNFAVQKINSGEVQGIVFIPQKFESGLKSNKGADLKLYLNTSRFLVSNDINKAVNEVVQTFNTSIILKYYQSQGYGFEQAKGLIEPIRANIEPLFNPSESYGNFLIPGLLVLILQQTLLLGLSESVAKEREAGILKNLYVQSDKNIFSAITGKSAFYFLLFSSYAFLFFGVHLNFFGISISGSLATLILLTVIFLISIIFLCIFIASFFKRKIVSLQIIAFTSYPVFLISGYAWPQEAMPDFIRAISNLIPSTPYLNAFNRIVNAGANFSDVKIELFHLIFLAVAGYFLAAFRIKALTKVEN